MTFDEWVKKNKDKDKQATVDWGGAGNRATPAKAASEAKSFDEWVTTNYGTQQQKDRYKATHAQPATQQPATQPSYQQQVQPQQPQQPTVNNAARVSEIQKQIAERETELKKYGTYTGAAKGSDPIGSIWARLSPTNWMPALKGEPTRYENAKTESKRLQDEIYQLNLELAKAQYGDSGNVGDYLLKTLQAEGGKLESEIEYLDPGFLDRVFNHDKWEEESAREEELRAKWRENKQSQDQMQYANYLNLMQSADFAQSSQPTGSKIVQTIGERGGYRYSAFNEGDKRYDYINNIDGYRDGYFVNDMAGNENLTKYEFMNPDEIGVYNYLYNKEGAESADKFLTTLDDVLNYRYGLAQAKDANTGIEKILYAIPAGLDQFSTGFEQVFKDEALPTTATQYAAGTIRQGNKDEGIEGMGAVGGFTYDLLQSAANMAPSILLSSLATAMGAPAAAGQIIGAGTMGMSAAGNAYNEKLKQGYDKGSARTYATLVGASEATLQYALGGLSSMGGKYSISKVASNISAIDNAFGRVALKVGAAAFSEGAEEALQEILEPIIATLTLNDKYDPAEIEDVMYSFLLGAVSGGLLEGGNVIAEDIHTRNMGFEAGKKDADVLIAMLQQGLESERGSTSYEVAVQLRQKLDSGKEITPYQLGRLYAEIGEVKAKSQPETPVQPEPEPEPMQPEPMPEQQLPPDIAAELEEAAREAAASEGMTIEDVAREVAERETAQDMPTEPAEQAQSEQQPANVKLPEAEEKPVKTAQEASKETAQDNTTVEAPEIKAAYEAGKTGLPMDKVAFVSEEQREAFNAGRMDAIREMPENTDISTKPVETAAKQEYTDSKETASTITLDSMPAQIKKALDKNRDWVSGTIDGANYITDGIITIPVEARIADARVRVFGDSLGRTVNNLLNNSGQLVDVTANPVSGKVNGQTFYVFTLEDGNQVAIQKKYAQYFDGNSFSVGFQNGLPSVVKVTKPDGSFAGVIMPLKGKKVDGKSYYFNVTDEKPVTMKSFKKKQTVKEDVSNGETALGEISHQSGVLEPDVRGQSAGGVLGEVAAESLQGKESRGDAVQSPQERGGETGRPADRSDAAGTGRGRSLGSSEGADIQSEAGRRSGDTVPDGYGVHEEGSPAAAEGGQGSRSDVGRSAARLNDQEDTNGLEERSGAATENRTGAQAEDGDRPRVSEEVGGDGQAARTGYASDKDRRTVIADAAEYDIPLEIVKSSEWVKAAPAYAKDKKIYVREDFPAEDAEQLIPHEATHVMRQMGFAPYLELLERVPDMINRETEEGELLLVKTAKHRKIDLLGELTEKQINVLYDEVNAKVASVAVKGIETPELLDYLRNAFYDYDAYKAELLKVHQQFKDRNKQQTVETTETEVTQKAELATQTPDRGVNFTIPESGLQLPKGEKARFKANVEAIKTLKTLMAENRRATPAEQEILSKYVGWGGLANAFDEKKTEWAKEYKQLKNLLTDKEYTSARGSTLNAHYTEIGVIRAMYAGLEKLGFKGGRVLEPSAGVGHFAGAMPQGIDARWTMVELDEITGNIAKYLYPNADVRVQGFETAKIPDNYMDMAVGNVPFGNYAIADKSYPKAVTSAIHNYFFAKSLDKVREGGIVAFITSRYTMDSQSREVREYIAKRADLLGAIRLPDTAFKGNAGTEVVTDILILKKRKEGTAYGGEEFLNVGSHHYSMGIYEQTNDYFAKHPEMVLGTPSKAGSMYRSNSLTYTAKPGNLVKQIEKAFDSIKGKMDYPVQRTQEEIRAEIKQNAGKTKNGSIIKKDGKLYRNNDGVLTEAEGISKAQEAAVSDIVAIRDTARELLNMQLDGASEKQIAEYRKTLNSQYDAFVKKNGALNLPKNKRLVNLDVDAPFILALENYDKETKTAKKADIFRKNTVTPVKTVTSVNTVEEGLIVSVNETGGVDVNRIAELLGENKETVTRILLDNRLAFKNREGKLETAEQYLSGNVKAKLRDAEALAEGDSDYNANVEELKKIIPADIPAEDIAVQPGVTWIPDSVYSDFAAETLGGRNSNYSKDVTVTYNKLLGTFSVTVNNQWLKMRAENTSTWGTPDRSFANILEATLNSKSVTVTRKLEDGSRVVDRQATAAAQEKQEKIKAEFTRWLWDNEQRKETLAKLYNDINNNYVTPKYDGSNLTVNGSNPEKPLRSHQKNAVQRIINSGGNTLLAHKVGAGKTYEMAAAAMKLRELGIVKKPMFVVPKSLVAQWGNEFLDFFPAAKILVLGEKDFSAANRKLFANRIATGDYDAVILSQEQFKAVPMSAENQEAFYQEQITALELAILETARTSGKRDPSIKQMEKSKKSFEAKLKKLGDIKKDTDNIDFEQLGIDAIFVDEAHSYKNLFYSTNMNNVSGLGNKEGSQKAFDMYMKVKYLQELNGGRGIVFATATPVMNSMSEMYIMQRYLQPDLLEARGLHSFDAWAKQFGEVRTVLEMNPSGKGFRQKQSFSRFKNLAELQQMFRAFADVLTDIPGLKIPAMKEGKRIIVESEPSDFQMEYIDKLAERADAVKNRKVDPKDDNMLKITSEGRKLSYTQRMIDPSMPYEDGNKIVKAAENVYNLWQESKGIKGTQLIFCDLSTPKGSTNTETEAETGEDIENISIYDDIKNMLVGMGVPAKEIAFIHDADTNEKKSKLFADVNDGKVRVLIGSTGKMGVGMNAQKRIVALHHLDAPWRPGDIEQREGRALRQGNINEEVGMYVYVTKQTFDSRMWDNLQRKATFIHQIMAGDLTARESEGDGDFALSAAEIKAISSGNPLIMEQFEVAADLQRLENLEKAHRKEIADAKKRIEKARLQITSDEVLAQHYREDIKRRQDTTGESFKLTIGKKVYTERKDAGEALIAEAKKRLDLSRQSETVTEIGSFAGFKLEVNNSGDIILKGSAQYRITANMQSPGGTVQSLEAQPKRIERMLETVETRLSENKQAIPKLEKTVNAPFDKADELESVRKRNAEILAELNPDDEANIAELDGADETESEVQHSKGATAPDKWMAQRVGSKDVQPKPLSEILEDIRHDFGINITKGHIRGQDVLGQYNRKNKGIRSKIANDLPTVAHELGHHLDNVYGLTKELPDDLKNELENGLDAGMKVAYKEDLWVTEGLAEYVRKFLQNHETAAIDYPEFTKHFKSTLSGSDLILIEKLADEVNAYYSLDADTATSAIRLSEEGAPDARTFGEKIKDKMTSLYQAWTDANHAIKRFDAATGSNAYMFASNAAYSDAMAGQIITGDLTDANGKFVGHGLKTALQGVDLTNKTEYRLFGEYLAVRHGPERLAEGMRIFADDRKNSTNFMQRRRAELEQQYPQFEDAAERLYDFQRTFLHTWGVETGLVSETSYDEWGERWQDYVPLNRAVSEESRRAGAKRGFANQNSTIKKAIGSGLEIMHPVDNIVTNIVKMVNAGVRNNVMRVITDSADKLGANAEWMEKVPAPLERHGFDMTGTKDDIIKMLQESDMDEKSKEKATDIVTSLDDILYQYSRGKAHGNVVAVLKKGKPEFWKVNDVELLQSVTTLSPAKMEGILDAYAVVSRFMTANITGYNIVWSLFSNFPRDIMTFFTYSKEKNPIKAFKAMGSAYVNKVNNSLGKEIDPLYREYIALGGGQQSAYTADRDLAKNARKKLSGKKTFGDYANPIEWLAYTSEIIEMGPRYATYKMMRQQGLNPQEAFYAAMDITVNFRRGGRVARELNKVIPFFNVSIQGLDKFRRWITAEELQGKPERAKVIRNRTLTYIAVSGAIAALFYALNNGDEEDEKYYEQLSNYQKNSFWNIPLGDGKFFAIPKPRELGVLSSFMERVMEAGIGENEHAFDEFYAYAAQNLLPKIASDVAQVGDKGVVETGMSFIGSLGLIGVFGYLGANRDFLGRPIVSEGLQALEKKDQYTNRTSKIAYWLGQATNSSPAQIDFFFQQVLGGFWKGQKALLPVGGENVDLTLGVQNTYVKDSQYSTDLVNWMYEKAEKSNKAKNSSPDDMALKVEAKMDDTMTSFYSKYYKLAKDKKETEASRAARQTVLNMILEYQKAADSGYKTDVQAAVYDIVAKQDKTELLPSAMQNTIKDADGKEHTLTDVDYVEFQTDYNRLYWEYVESNLGGAVSDLQKAAVLRSAKTVALEEARRRTLGRIGANAGAAQYGSTDNTYAVSYKAARYVANEDGKVTQDEVINILDRLLDEGLDSNSAYDIYLSEYSEDDTNSKKVATGAKQAGIDADTFLEYKYNLNNLEYEKGVNGARKKAYTEMLDKLGLTEEQYDYLFGTEYKTSSDDKDGGLFGGGFSGGFTLKW